MPEPQAAQRNRGREKADPFKNFKIPIKGISGMNTALPPTEIEDTDAQAIYNYLPITKSMLRKVAAPLPIIMGLSSNSILVWNDVLGLALIMFTFLADGSMGLVSGGLYTEVAPPGTFSSDAKSIDIQNWQNQVFLIVDKNSGYFYFDGTTLTAISAPPTPSTGTTLQGLPGGLNPPAAPATGSTSGGSLTGTTYYVKVTYVTATGETICSAESSQVIADNNLLTVTSPAAIGGATGWNVWVGTATGAETKQNPTPISIGTGWTEPTTDLISGALFTQIPLYVKTTYVTANGETIPSGEATQDVAYQYSLTVTSPAAATRAIGYNVYVGTTTGEETLQNTSPIDIGTNWTMPATGLQTTYRNPPTLNTTAGFSLISSSLAGRTIGVWAGRVFIANGRNLNYSVAGSYLDFTSTGSGYFQIKFTDLKQEIVRLIPYIDSFFVIGDHGIIALQGTTISNDPQNWYQMEIFNNAGTVYPPVLFNWNNILFLVNEFGIWMIASTQSQLLNYKLDLTQFTFNNYRGTITQIGTLNFYLIPIRMYSGLSFAYQDVLLAYCIELKEFYFLEFDFPVKGVYATLSETDHSVYVWGNNAIYKLFAGTGALASRIDTKLFDLGDPFVYKAVRYLLATHKLISGSPNFTAICNIQPSNSTLTNAAATQSSISFAQAILWNNANYPLYDVGFTNTYGSLIGFRNSLQNKMVDQIYWFSMPPPYGFGPFAAWSVSAGVGGTQFSFTIKENTNAVFDVVKFFIEGFIGRRIR